MAAERLGRRDLKDLLPAERARVFSQASPAERERMKRAEKSSSVYRAWNAVCEARAAEHVTGLFYAEADDALVVYVDSPAWCQELDMSREVYRTRLSCKGVDLARLAFRVSKEGYGRKRSPRAGASLQKPAPAPLPELDERERSEVAAGVAPLADPRLREALQNAMIASRRWKKSRNLKNEP